MIRWDIEAERKTDENGTYVVYDVSDKQYEEMKQRFVDYLEGNKCGYPSEIAEAVGVPIQFSLKIVGDLREEGKIERCDFGNER